MSIEQTLVGKYGPMISLRQLADVLDKSAEALRLLLRSPGAFPDAINKHRSKLGRRVYFKTAGIAQVLDSQESGLLKEQQATTPMNNEPDQSYITDMIWAHYPEGGGQMLVALACASFAQPDGTGIVPILSEIARMTRQSERTVQRQLVEMQKAGWLMLVRPAGRGRGVEYRINPDWLSNPGAKIEPQERAA